MASLDNETAFSAHKSSMANLEKTMYTFLSLQGLIHVIEYLANE